MIPIHPKAMALLLVVLTSGGAVGWWAAHEPLPDFSQDASQTEPMARRMAADGAEPHHQHHPGFSTESVVLGLTTLP